MLPGIAGIIVSVAGAGDGGSASPYGAHRYWRVFVVDNNGGNFIAIGEIELLLTSGGADQTTSAMTVLASSELPPGNAKEKAFNDNLADGWAVNSSLVNQYIGIDFGAGNAKAIQALTMMGNTGAGVSPDRMPKNFKLQYSDDNVAWSDAFSAFEIGWISTVKLEYPVPPAAPGYHRWWRVFCEANNGGTLWNLLNEVEFRATPGGADQATGGRVVCTNGDSVPDNAFNDNTGGDFWYGNATTNRWIGYVFAAPVKVEQVWLHPGAGQTSRNPRDFRIEYSDDGVTWTQAKRYTGVTWTSGVAQTFSAV